MAFSLPAPRRHMHTRSISCEGFLREDGLWDIEARIIDTKPFAYEEPFRGRREAGEHVHDMAVRLTIDRDMVVRGIEVTTGSAPYDACFGVARHYAGLVGERIGPGWRRAVQQCVGGTRGCTHLRELLFPVATVAYQTLSGWRAKDDFDESRPAEQGGRPYFIDGCAAWAADGPVVARLYPEHAKRS